ncbi:interleukin-23 receptor isoform X2 [Hypomesus transpacificus]|uniref:interleukin-23 receptor isoform X2 n=1 Tax=Hypomesus transpacificus TaxID=137520 RepID=UPI001F086202|nr:interleukin-23 receptor isoform X2 [Hypomesus transpacificus]
MQKCSTLVNMQKLWSVKADPDLPVEEAERLSSAGKTLPARQTGEMSSQRAPWTVTWLLHFSGCCSLLVSSEMLPLVTCPGTLTVDTGAKFLAGSNLKVSCHYADASCLHDKFVLELDGVAQHEGWRENCSSARFHLTGVHGSSLICRLQKRKHMFQTICGIDLYPQYPDAPGIVNVLFANDSTSAEVLWASARPSLQQAAHLRFRKRNGSWVEKQATDLGLCAAAGAHRSARRALEQVRSVAGPSQEPDVWRVMLPLEKDGARTVIVMWKHPGQPGSQVWHELAYLEHGDTQRVHCAADTTQHSLLLSPEVRALEVTALTSYGRSPTATLYLNYTVLPAQVLTHLAGANGSVVLSWTEAGAGDKAGAGDEAGAVLLGYVVEWRSGSGVLGWQRVSREQRSTSITGLDAGVRYQVSLHADTSRGGCELASSLVYSRQQKPLAGPRARVVSHQAGEVVMTWEELALEEQRGFITHYSIYVRAQGAPQRKDTVLAGEPRRHRLVCPKGYVSLSVSASTSVGEGPLGAWMPCPPPPPAVIWVVGVATVVMVLLVNLLFCRYIRMRVKHTCMTFGPACLVESPPQPDNSNAIKLLLEVQQEVQQTCWSRHSDPVLSLIEEVSQEERGEVYPDIHMEHPITRPSQAPGEGTEIRGGPSEGLSPQTGYKPQTSAPVPPPQEPKGEEEEAREERQEEDGMSAPCWKGSVRDFELPGGLLGTWLCDLGLSASPIQAQTSVGCLLSPVSPQMTSLFPGEAWLRGGGYQPGAQQGSGGQGGGQGGLVSLEENGSHWSQWQVEACSYFPQTDGLINTS